MALDFNALVNFRDKGLLPDSMTYNVLETLVNPTISNFDSWLKGFATLDGWTGPASESARAELRGCLAFLDKATLIPWEMIGFGADGALQGSGAYMYFARSMAPLSQQAENLAKQGQQEQLEVNPDGSIRDQLETSGLINSLSPDDRQKHERYKAQFTQEVKQLTDAAVQLDQQTAARLRSECFLAPVSTFQVP